MQNIYKQKEKEITLYLYCNF